MEKFLFAKTPKTKAKTKQGVLHFLTQSVSKQPNWIAMPPHYISRP
jgi:hypothetical protein